jgi:hypothetical protein
MSVLALIDDIGDDRQLSNEISWAPFASNASCSGHGPKHETAPSIRPAQPRLSDRCLRQ